MTISTQTRVAIYTGNGSTTVFPFDFPVYASSDLEVHLYTLATNSYVVVSPSDYSTTGIGLESTGGTVTFELAGEPLTNEYAIAIYRTVQYVQELDIRNQSGFYPDTLERQFDKIVMQIQQVADGLSRAVLIPPTADVDSEDLVVLILQIAGMLDQIQTVAGIEDEIVIVAGMADMIAQVAAITDELDLFYDTYLGASATDPTVDRDGNPLVDGQLYTNTGDNPGLRTYASGQWLLSTAGWAPELAVIEDGARRVLQIVDWIGGAGAKPAVGDYIGVGGLVPLIEDAVDIRGAQGVPGSITDSDKGDVLVSSSGTVWTVQSAAGSMTVNTGLRLGRFNGSTQIENILDNTAGRVLDLADFPNLSTASASVRIFRGTNTSGTRNFAIFRGDGTATFDHQFTAGTSGTLADLARNGGNVLINGQLAWHNGNTTGIVTDAKVATPGTPATGIAATKLTYVRSGAGAVAETIKKVLDDELSVMRFGAVNDAVYVNLPVTIASGTAALTVAGMGFVPGDVGKVITVPGAGAAGADLHTTIAAYVGPTQVTLANNASTTLAAVSKLVFYGTNNSAAFLAAFNDAPELGKIIIPAGGYQLLTAVSQTAKNVHWIMEPGAVMNVPALANVFRDRCQLLDYASGRDAASGEYWGTVKVGGEAGKYLNWTIGPTGTPYSYQKNLLQAYVLQFDPSSGLGNGDPGPNISRDGVGADIRAYIGDGNMTGRAFGLNVIAAHQGTSEGMLNGIEVDIANGASNVPSFDDNTVDFPKSGIGVVSKGPNHVTMAYHFMEGGGKFYVGLYGTIESLVDHPESRFLKLRDAFSVYRHGHVTVGKDHSNLYLAGVEVDPAGQINISRNIGGYLNFINTEVLASPAVVGTVIGTARNASGTEKQWGGVQIYASATTAGSERSAVLFTAQNGAGTAVQVGSMDIGGLELTGGGKLRLDNTVSTLPAVEFMIGGAVQSSVDDNGGSINVKSNAAGTQGMYITHGTSAWGTISDARLPWKKTARDLTVLDKLGPMKLYENEVEGRRELFVKAQEFYEAFPHLVKVGSGPDDYEPAGLKDPAAWGVSYERAGVVALQGVKELHALVLAQAQQLKTMQAKVDRLERALKEKK